MEKKCIVCNSNFIAKTKISKCCSKRCTSKYHYNKRYKKKTYNKIYIVCSKDFICVGKNTKYCSKKCGSKDYRINNKEKIKQYRLDNKEKSNEARKENIEKDWKLRLKFIHEESLKKPSEVQIKRNLKAKQKRKDMITKVNLLKRKLELDPENLEVMVELSILKPKLRSKISHKTKNNPLFKLKRNVRSRLKSYMKLKKIKSNNSALFMIGCTPEDLKKHLESQFRVGMSWKNYGKWEIDHIIPLSLANSEAKIIELSHYTNLQPLWAEENRRKSNKLI